MRRSLMSEREEVTAFCAAVDRILNGEEVPSDSQPLREMADLLVLAECLATTHYRPSEATFQYQLETSILRHDARRQGESRWASVTRLLVAAMRLHLRPVLTGSLLVLLVAGVALLSLNPAVRAQIEDVLRWTTVHEISDLPQPFYLEDGSPSTELPSPVPLFIAKIRANFSVKQPDYVPEGYQFDGAMVLALHDYADGPTILLFYGGSDGGFVIEESRPLHSVGEAVATDSSNQLEVNGQPALYIDGRWKIDEEGVYQGWVSGDHDRLLYEMNDIAIWIHASPPLGPEELVRIAESLQ
jgi:hypothetical protein